MTAALVTTFKKMVPRYLGRPWREADGISATRLERATRRLKLRSLPASLRAFYSAIGNVHDLTRVHNEIRAPEDLYFDEEHLMFMDENQSVVSWGIRVKDLPLADPIIWQRNNTPPTEWFSERRRLAPLLKSMFDWYGESGIWPQRKRKSAEPVAELRASR